MIEKIKKVLIGHKIISGIVIVVVLAGGLWWYNTIQNGTTIVKYVVENAVQGTVVTTVSESGQVNAVTTINIQPHITETVISVPAKVGSHVVAGQILVILDTKNEEKALKQANLSLQSAQLSLAKLQKPPTAVSLGQSQNAVTKSHENLLQASTTLQKDYQNAFDTLGSSFVDFQNVMSQLQSFVVGTDINKSQSNPDAYVNLMPNYLQITTRPYRDDVISHYAAALAAYQSNLADYHAKSRYNDEATLDSLFSETYTTSKLISESVKSVKSMLNFIVNNYPTNLGLAQLPTITNTFQTSFGNYTNTANNDVSNILSAMNAIASDKTAMSDARLSLDEASTSLASLVAGADSLDVQSQQLNIAQAQASVETAQENLNNCYIRAPIAGIVSVVNAVVGETVSSLTVSMIGEGQIAEITMSETDAINVKIGNRATLTFDAIEGLSIAGTVTEIDPVGVVSQGVVSYSAKISFNDTTNRVKPGMSVSADIATATHQDVIIVPSSAIQTVGSSTYVLIPLANLSDTDLAASANGGVIIDSTKRALVTTGLSDGTVTEINSGLKTGDQVIVKTIKSTAASASSGSSASASRSSGSLLNVLGGSRGGVPPAGR